LVSVPQRRNDRYKANQKTLERLRPIVRVAFARQDVQEIL